MNDCLLSLARWCQVMAGMHDNYHYFFDRLNSPWWQENHEAYTLACIVNRLEYCEFYPDLGWVPVPLF